MRETLAVLGNACRSVVACRARKDQKAKMLSLIRKNVAKSCCSAIGDGANDVAMIKEGQIGVGIIGKEGREAMMASDFAIGKFMFLRSLLLVHGRYNYKRFAIFLYFSVYKNVLCQMVLYFWSLFAGASTQLLLPSIFIDLINPIAMTALPIIAYPMFDTDMSKRRSAAMPELYTAGIARTHFTHRKMFWWVTEALYAAAVIAFAPLVFARASSVDAVYEGGSLPELSMATMWTICISINLRLTLENNSWTYIEAFSLGLMLSLLGVFFVFFNYVPSTEYGGSFSWPLLVGTLPSIMTSFGFGRSRAARLPRARAAPDPGVHPRPLLWLGRGCAHPQGYTRGRQDGAAALASCGRDVGRDGGGCNGCDGGRPQEHADAAAARGARRGRRGRRV